MADNVKQVVPCLLVMDMERSLRYYRDGLGFVMKNQWIVGGNIRWCWLEFGGAALMLQQFHKPPANKIGEGVALCFQCGDAIALYHEFISRGVDASEPQVGNGLWDTRLSDPDGYWLRFASPADAPEETKLSEWIAQRPARDRVLA
jgi:lactoylglutathione lyase